MTKNTVDKKYENIVIETIALNWGVNKRTILEHFNMFKKQNTK